MRAASNVASPSVGERAQQRLERGWAARGLLVRVRLGCLGSVGCRVLGDGRGVRAEQHVEQARVVVADVALDVHLQQAHGHRVGETSQQLLAFLEHFLGVHLGRDVDDFDEHVVAPGFVEEVLEGRVDPHPAAVLAPAAQARLLGAPRGEDREPALDRAALVVGVDLVEHGLAVHVLEGVAEHFRERLVAVDHARALVLGERAEARRRGRLLVADAFGLLLALLLARQDHGEHDAVDLAQVDEVQRHPARGLAQQAHFARDRALLAQAHPQPRDRVAVGGHDVVEHRAALDQALPPESHRLRHGHDQAVVREPRDEGVGVLA